MERKRVLIICALAFVLSVFFPGCKKEVSKAKVTEVNGIRQVINPVQPLKGKVQLELEKKLELNPYNYPGFKLRHFRVIRNKNLIIFYDPNEPKAEMFTSDGKYLHSFIQIGQGPGEFPSYSGFFMEFVDNEIWAIGNMKVARFDRDGILQGEFKIPDLEAYFVDPSHYLTFSFSGENNQFIKKLELKKFFSGHSVTSVELLKGINVGLIRWQDKQGGFYEAYGTNDMVIAINKEERILAAALKSDPRIKIFNMEGKPLMIIEIPMKRVQVNREEKEKLLSSVSPDSRTLKEMVRLYPDKLMALLNLGYLARGYLGVYRVVAPGKWQLDVLSPEGKYLYALEFPQEFLKYDYFDFDFTESGFSLINRTGDYPIYEEYRIKNLPELFQ